MQAMLATVHRSRDMVAGIVVRLGVLKGDVGQVSRLCCCASRFTGPPYP